MLARVCAARSKRLSTRSIGRCCWLGWRRAGRTSSTSSGLSTRRWTSPSGDWSVGSGVPLVYTVHNLVPHDARPDDVARYGGLYHAADTLVVHSQRSATALSQEWGIPPERIVVVPHGPLLEDWPPLPRAEARRRLGLPLDAELVLFAGLIEPYKGLDDLIAAFDSVAARRPAAAPRRGGQAERALRAMSNTYSSSNTT